MPGWDRLARRCAWVVLVWLRLPGQAELELELPLQRQEQLRRVGGVQVEGLLRGPLSWLGCLRRCDRGRGFGCGCGCHAAVRQ